MQGFCAYEIYWAPLPQCAAGLRGAAGRPAGSGGSCGRKGKATFGQGGSAEHLQACRSRAAPPQVAAGAYSLVSRLLGATLRSLALPLFQCRLALPCRLGPCSLAGLRRRRVAAACAALPLAPCRRLAAPSSIRPGRGLLLFSRLSLVVHTLLLPLSGWGRDIGTWGGGTGAVGACGSVKRAWDFRRTGNR